MKPTHRPSVTRLGRLLGPGDAPGYAAIFNAGVVVLDGEYHLFARGVRDGYRPGTNGGPRFVNYFSDILWFSSSDGIDYRFRKTLLTAAHPVTGYEDPRLQWVNADGGGRRLVMTYTHVEADRPWRIGLCELDYRTGEFTVVEGSNRLIGVPDVADKDAVLFHLADGRLALYHRVYPNMQLAVFEDLDALLAADVRFWEDHHRNLESHTVLRVAPWAHQVGAGPAPLPVDGKLLLFFHQRGRDQVYRNHAALIDPDSGLVERFLREPLLEPQTAWERNGDVRDVVYVQGAQLIGGDTVYLTYGAADRYVAAASVDLNSLLEALNAAPPLGPVGGW